MGVLALLTFVLLTGLKKIREIREKLKVEIRQSALPFTGIDERDKREKKEGKKERRCERKRDYERSGGAAMNIKAAIIKFYRKTLDKFFDTMSWQKFCKENTKAITIKGKKCTLNSIKIKTFCSSKDIIKKIKNQATVREKIFAAHIYDKGLIYRICKEVLHFNN